MYLYEQNTNMYTHTNKHETLSTHTYNNTLLKNPSHKRLLRVNVNVHVLSHFAIRFSLIFVNGVFALWQVYVLVLRHIHVIIGGLDDVSLLLLDPRQHHLVTGIREALSDLWTSSHTFAFRLAMYFQHRNQFRCFRHRTDLNNYTQIMFFQLIYYAYRVELEDIFRSFNSRTEDINWSHTKVTIRLRFSGWHVVDV